MLRTDRRRTCSVGSQGCSQLSQGEAVEAVDRCGSSGSLKLISDDDGDRDEHVDEHQQPEDQDQVVADPAAQPDARSQQLLRPGAADVDEHHTTISTIRITDSAAAAG